MSQRQQRAASPTKHKIALAGNWSALQDSTPRITTGRALDGKRHAEEVPFVTLTDQNGQFHSSGYFLKYTVYDDTSGRCQLTLQVLVQGYFYYRQE